MSEKPARSRMSQAPNVLVIMSDQHAPHVLGSTGQTCVKTPHLDALAARGVRFTKAYCAHPLCTPSRASFMTGLLTPEHNVWELGSPLRSDLPTWTHALRSAGYVTSISGRMHFIGNDQHHGFERRVCNEVRPTVRPFAYDPWLQPIEDEHVMLGAVQAAGPTDAPTKNELYDAKVQQAALDELEHLSSQRETTGRPWALTLGYIQPHAPYQVSRRWWDMYEGEQIDLPPRPPGGESFTQNLPELFQGSRRWLGNTDDGLTDEEIRSALRAYYVMTTQIDHYVGQLVEKLATLGELENTIILYTSDHGDNIGHHGQWSKLNFFDASVGVPMIVAGPGITQGRCDAPVSLLDWVPTMVSLASRVKPDAPAWPVKMAGEDLWQWLREPGHVDQGRAVIADYACGGTRVPLRMVVRGRYKACFGPPLKPVLFDLQNDPDEWHNLADSNDTKTQQILAELYDIARADGWSPELVLAHVTQEKKTLKYLDLVEGGERAAAPFTLQ